LKTKQMYKLNCGFLRQQRIKLWIVGQAFITTIYIGTTVYNNTIYAFSNKRMRLLKELNYFRLQIYHNNQLSYYVTTTTTQVILSMILENLFF
jgi:hypothetical protein